MYPKDKILLQLKQNIVYKWSHQEEDWNLSYKGEYSRYLENRVKEHSSHVTSAVYLNSVSNKYPQGNISYFKIIDQNSKQVAKETIDIRINNPAIKQDTGKMHIPELFNHLLEADGSINKSN